jgi:GWxTD domain-containing protein
MVTSADVQLMIDVAWYHLSEAEKMRIKDLSDDGKVNLLQQFWRDRDDDPSTPENPFYEEAVRRFHFANKFFSTSSVVTNGWRTDRGRIYITYGPYDDETEEVMTGRSYPYILWRYYQLEGGCIFVFTSDFVAGAADYRLVHSTHPRERYDPTWENILLDADERDDQWEGPGDEY